MRVWLAMCLRSLHWVRERKEVGKMVSILFTRACFPLKGWDLNLTRQCYWQRYCKIKRVLDDARLLWRGWKSYGFTMCLDHNLNEGSLNQLSTIHDFCLWGPTWHAGTVECVDWSNDDAWERLFFNKDDEQPPPPKYVKKGRPIDSLVSIVY